MQKVSLSYHKVKKTFKKEQTRRSGVRRFSRVVKAPKIPKQDVQVLWFMSQLEFSCVTHVEKHDFQKGFILILIDLLFLNYWINCKPDLSDRNIKRKKEKKSKDYNHATHSWWSSGGPGSSL